MNTTRLEEIVNSLDTVSTEIVVPLRGKVIDEAAFSRLFELMDELQDLLCDEKLMPKKLVRILFHIYTQLDMQAGYVRKDETKIVFTLYLAKMRSRMRGVFGENIHQNTGVKELSAKDIMENSGFTDLQEVMDELK
ncbi:hypothetical protein [Paenibacillus sp. FSL R7-0331]|uniref:hypothetical protein n=1 Tax=Paenibacillus sp. FSL R7-0331 TaxID=1536773 RepID=UPI0004F628CE|nr:hypothetical protein [Paenibacillus sp. FSL R7-0331]AIQ52247.1 hypothetical protein R70331_12525 [Paenibacillus sp. FSL R7-0331]